jgi:hypothetical protein
MAQVAVRFGVPDGRGHRAESWKCFAEKGKGKNDVYLTCRRLGGVIKASFHESGDWLVDYDGNAFPTMFDDANKPATRFPMRWPRPPEILPGITLAGRVFVPWYASTIPDSALDSKVTWKQPAPQGRTVVFTVALASKERQFGEGDTAKTQLVGELGLDSGERVWVMHHVVNWNDPPPRWPFRSV